MDASPPPAITIVYVDPIPDYARALRLHLIFSKWKAPHCFGSAEVLNTETSYLKLGLWAHPIHLQAILTTLRRLLF